MIDWHPIETAPKGRHVLIGAKDGLPAEVCYTLPVLISIKMGQYWAHSGQAWTHWAEIPEPPK